MDWPSGIDSSSQDWIIQLPPLESQPLMISLQSHGVLLTSVSGFLDEVDPLQHSQTQKVPEEPPAFRTTWTKQQDELLANLVVQLKRNWSKIDKRFPNKKAGSAQKRWISKHDPNVKRTKWSPQQDQIILDFYYKFGGNWKQIAKQLAGREPDNVKNRFYGTLRKKMNVSRVERVMPSCNQGKLSGFLGIGDCYQEDIIDSLLAEEKREDDLSLQSLNIANAGLELDSLSAEDMRKKIQELYGRMASLEAIISHTKQQIRSLHSKKINN